MTPVQETVTGLTVLKEWLGDGGVPVSREQAEFRSTSCTTGCFGEPCPLNIEPNWWGRVKHKVADAIKEHLEVKNGIGLAVDKESELHMCKVCGCCLPLLVWVPTDHLAKRMTPQELLNYPHFCWKRKELLKNTGDL
jgi:hypothetical protein